MFLNSGLAIIRRATFTFRIVMAGSSVVFGSIQSNQWMNGSLRVKIRKANKISNGAKPVRVELEEELKHGFFIHYDNGQTAEVSWSFVRELAPKNSKK